MSSPELKNADDALETKAAADPARSDGNFSPPKSKGLAGGRFKKLLGEIARKQNGIVRFLLVLLILSYSLLFGAASILSHETFITYAFDFGIWDQGVWLISQGKVPFNTIRGLHQFGDHATFIMYLVAPIFWIWDDANALLLLRTLALALGALPLFWIAREKLKSPWPALLVAGLYLLYPALQNFNLDFGHSETFAPLLLLFAFWSIMKGRLLAYGVFCLLALLCKEDVSITLFALGLYVAWFYNRKVGLATSILSCLWLLLVVKIFLPHFNQVGFYRFTGNYWFAGFYQNMFQPKWYLATFIKPEVGQYLLRLLAPLFFLPLLSPVFLVALPAIVINILSGSEYLISIDYHYTSSIIPFIFIATISAFALLSRSIPSLAPVFRWKPKQRLFLFGFQIVGGNPGAVLFALALILTETTLVTQSMWSRLPLREAVGKTLARGAWLRTSPYPKSFQDAARQIPSGAAVSADYSLASHISHREKIYMFPNPFLVNYWGINGEEVPDPSHVDFILIREGMVAADQPANRLMGRLIKEGLFTQIYSKEDIGLYRRVSMKPIREMVGPNLVANGLGKDGFKGWRLVGGETRSNLISEDEGKSLSWQFTWVAPGAADAALESDAFPIKGGEIYTLSADLWTGGQSKGTAKVRVDWYNSEQAQISEGLPAISPPLAISGWRSRSVRLYSPPTATFARVRLIIDNFPQTTDTRFQKIKLEEGTVRSEDGARS